MWRWLESTHELQRKTYGYPIEDFADLAVHGGGGGKCDGNSQEIGDLCKYVDWNQVAAVQEMAELREEFSWKPWATDPPFVNRERIIKESVDVLHFIGNILVGLGVTDEELWDHYQKKQEINRQRAASGTYSAIKGGLAQGSD